MSRVVAESKIELGSWMDSLTLSKLPSGVAVLELHVKGSTNSLSSQVLDSFVKALKVVDSDHSIKALILTSGKEEMFITGADIKEIAKLESEAAGKDLAKRGQNFFNALTEIHCPTVSAVHGICLGGGLELIMCSDKRIASDSKNTEFGLPELSLGLIPGLGGTQRLPRLIGFRKAIDMILSSEAIPVKQALELGLIDKIVNENELLAEAEKLALELHGSKFDKKAHLEKVYKEVEEKDGGIKKRQSILKMSQRVVRMRGGEHYPAPPKAVNAIKVGFEEGIEKGLEAEVDAFGILACSEESRNLISFYFSKEMASQMAKRNTNKCNPPKTIAIIGSGFMGKGIAELLIQKGFDVILQGSNEEKSAKAVDQIKGKLKSKENDLGAIRKSSGWSDLKSADIVIESVTEDLAVKKEVLAEIEKNLGDNAIICSNTSSIPLSSLSDSLKHRDRLVGVHFFNPITLMPLIEVISLSETSKDTQVRAMSLVSLLKRVPVQVKDSPGFVVNRLLTCYITEAVRMAISGIPLNWIDDAAKKFGMPLGPFELLDELGWGLSRAVSNSLASGFGKRLKLPEEMDKPISLGYEGKQNNIGCYLFEDKSKNLGLNPEFVKFLGGRTSSDSPEDKDIEDIQDWLFLTMVDEAARCLEEKVVRKARDIDLALVTGAGFPPFRGGLLRYADKVGIDYVIENLERVYIDNKQDRQVSNFLKDMHNIGRKFYSLG